MNVVDVTCAVIVKDDRILITRRADNMSRPGKWEFPGGKIEKDESAEECILREIEEELNLKLKIKNWIDPVVHHYPDISIRLIPCIAEIGSGELTLHEHSEFKWVKPDELDDQDWAPADIPVIKQISDNPLKFH